MTAVHEQDAAAVFDTLMPTTRSAFDTVAREQRRMRALIERSYPREEQARALAHFYPQATSGRDLFRLLYPRRFADDFQRRLGPQAKARVTLDPAGNSATCERSGGAPFRFGRTVAGTWGMGELDAEWDLAQVRAVHDADTVRENARLYSQTNGAR